MTKNTKLSATDKTYLAIRNLIIQEKVHGFLDEERLSKLLNVSRTPIREAFYRLQADRMIELIPRKGAYVMQLTTKELIDVYNTRKLIESYAVNYICTQNVGKAPQKMRLLLSEMKDNSENDDHSELIKLDIEFHRILVESVNNETLLHCYDSMQSRKMWVANIAVQIKPERRSIIVKEHEEFLDALDAKDSEKAIAVLNKHLEPVIDILSNLPQR